MTWSEFNAIVRNNHSFLVTSHVNPDGDCIGSQLAIAWYLESLGKQVTICDHDPVPYKFTFLTGSKKITVATPTKTCDVLVVVDASNLQRLGWEQPESIAPVIINIDHHHDNTRFGHCNVVRSAAATAQILFDLFEEGGVTYPQHVAETLYLAILTDTGGFRFSNTNASVLQVCATLAQRGADPAKVYECAYASSTRNGMQLFASIWPSLAFHLDGRVCTLELPIERIAQFGATYGDSEGLADLTITVENVQVGVFIKYSSSQTHFSLRSKSAIDVGSMARKVAGGGGHVNAAGCTMDLPRDEALPRMLDIIRTELD